MSRPEGNTVMQTRILLQMVSLCMSLGQLWLQLAIMAGGETSKQTDILVTKVPSSISTISCCRSHALSKRILKCIYVS
jgi:hypothetical protein